MSVKSREVEDRAARDESADARRVEAGRSDLREPGANCGMSQLRYVNVAPRRGE